MTSSLVKYKLSELATFKYGKTIRKSEIQEVGNFPVYSGYQIVGYLPNYKYEEPQLIIVCRGVGGTGDIKISPPNCSITNLAIVISCDENIVDMGYLYWKLLLSDTYSLRTGSAQPQITINTLENFTIEIEPDIDKQREIADILFCFNDKIELNRQINQTLEQIAQAIFKSWFVDFDPVKAKIQANQNGQDLERAAMRAISGKTDEELDQLSPEHRQQLAETAALFPDELEDSEIGEIPKEWNYGTLDELCWLNKNSWTKKNAPDEVRYVDLANTNNGVIEDIQYYDWEKAPSRARRILKPRDTIVGTVRPGNRSFALIGERDKQLTGSTGFAVLTPKKSEYQEYIYIASTRDANIERLAHLADGAAYPAVRPDIVTNMEIAIADEEVFKKFSEIARPIFSQREYHFSQNNILEGCRNTLLPKLLSGEICLDDTQSTVVAMA